MKQYAVKELYSDFYVVLHYVDGRYLTCHFVTGSVLDEYTQALKNDGYVQVGWEVSL